MILDSVSRLPLYELQIPGAARIAAAFESKDPAAALCEVREKHYALKDDTKRRFEVHGHTIDLMIAREGTEIIHICPMDRLIPAETLPNGGDGRKLDGRRRVRPFCWSKDPSAPFFPVRPTWWAEKPTGKRASSTSGW